MALFRLRQAFVVVLACLALSGCRSAAAPAAPAVSATAEREALVNGFRQEAVYLNDSDKPMGARWVHARTGFTLDLLDIQSVPQGFIWVNSFPTSDMGEPHTQEHLLLSKGNRGRAMASLETMALSGSSAFTQQLRTAYHFNTAAGPETFYTIFERQMDALLHPDYSDEEIRREVRNFGVSENPADRSLRIEEKGTVYNEMTSSFDRPGSRQFRAASQLVYGERHPLSYSSGGWPAAIREMQPAHIRKFHADNYHLANMGMVSALPRTMPAPAVLARMDAILNRLEPNPVKRDFPGEDDLPAPQPAPPGTIRIEPYPHRNANQPGNVALVWPANRQRMPEHEHVLAGIFLSNLAGDATTNLYKAFVDGRTRRMDVGATGVFGFMSDDLGYPAYVGLSNVEPRHMTEPMLDSVRRTVMAEIARIAALPDDAPELADFNTRAKSRIIQLRRSLANIVNSPPGFGIRGTGSLWMEHLDDLAKIGRFQRSLTAKPELAWVDSVLAAPGNPWRAFVARWRLTSDVPYIVAMKPDPEMLAREQADRDARAAAETARLRARFATADDQETLRRFRTQYDSITQALDLAAAADAAPKFIDQPPMTLDEALDWRMDSIGGRVPFVVSTFDNMTSATAGVALRLDGVDQRDLVFVSLMPGLLTQSGVIENGVPIPFEQMSERLRREILNLNAGFSTNHRTGRAELVVRGSGNDIAEATRAVGWMRLALTSPDWRPENLQRIRDVVSQAATNLRNVTQGSEESWVNGVANAYRRQDSPLLLATTSFMTQAHNAHRLKWMLREPGTGAERDAIRAFLTKLGEAGRRASRAELDALLSNMRSAPAGAAAGGRPSSGAGAAVSPVPVPASLAPLRETWEKLPPGAKALASQAAGDLAQLLTDVPDATLAADWAYLCAQIRDDLMMPPGEALARLDAVRRSLLATGGARSWMVGSSASQAALAAPLGGLLSSMTPTARPGATETARATGDAGGIVTSRLRDRARAVGRPTYVALVQPNLQSGVFLNSAPLVSYADTTREDVLRYLASKLYGGGGAHGIFMKTWGAGLAYSNGLGGSPGSGRISYYAERTPELPQTLRFVIEELKKAKPDPALAEYAMAVAFQETRAPLSYEARAEAMAADLADGLTPDRVRRFRERLLSVRGMPGLADSLFARMPAVYATVLPGFEKGPQPVPDDAVYMVIGSERQLGLWEEYLKTAVASDERLHRLYPRDFWLTAEKATP